MIVERATPDLVQKIARQMNQLDFEELQATCGGKNRNELAIILANQVATEFVKGGVISKETGKFISFLGWSAPRPNEWTIGMYSTDKIYENTLGVNRFVIKNMVPLINLYNLKRLEAFSIDTHKIAHRWLEFLGMKKKQTLQKFGELGRTFFEFEWIKPDQNSNVAWLGRGKLT